MSLAKKFTNETELMPELETSLFLLLIVALGAYLLGSVPFGVVITRIMGLGNLRDIGAGNIGATNVLRTGHKAAAAMTLLLDGGKGAVAVLLARALVGAGDAIQLAALAVMIGHCFPVWLNFKGGKGVATFLGVMLAFHWPAGIACCLAWLVGALAFRISSVGAIFAASFSIVFLLMMGQGTAMLLALILTFLVFNRHRDNIKRIRAGTEPKIGQKIA